MPVVSCLSVLRSLDQHTSNEQVPNGLSVMNWQHYRLHTGETIGLCLTAFGSFVVGSPLSLMQKALCHYTEYHYRISLGVNGCTPGSLFNWEYLLAAFEFSYPSLLSSMYLRRCRPSKMSPKPVDTDDRRWSEPHKYFFFWEKRWHLELSEPFLYSVE